jgi:hypothetical protein
MVPRMRSNFLPNSSIFTMRFEYGKKEKEETAGETERVLWIPSASRRENEPRHIRMDGSRHIVELHFSLSQGEGITPPRVPNLHNLESTR